LQDVADVDYMVLDDSDSEYLYTYISSISEKHIVACNAVEHSYLVFDRNGKPVGKVAKEGNGPDEYVIPLLTLYSDSQDELYIATYFNGIYVYSREGRFKRKIPLRKGVVPGGIYEYDENHLLCYDENAKTNSFSLLSRKDGEVTDISIPFKSKIGMMLFHDGMPIYSLLRCFAVKQGQDFLLNDYSADTIFRFRPDHTLTPALIRTPSVQEMEQPIIVYAFLETTQYSFLATQRKYYDFARGAGMEIKGYVIDKKKGKRFLANVVNRDYAGQHLDLTPDCLAHSSQPGTGYNE
jgi:hypothetical protein